MLGGNMKSKMKCTLKLIALMLIFTSIGGCSVKQKAHTKQAQTVTSSSIKEDTATVTQRQVNFLKKHESEITDYIKSNDPEVVQVKYDWDSAKALQIVA